MNVKGGAEGQLCIGEKKIWVRIAASWGKQIQLARRESSRRESLHTQITCDIFDCRCWWDGAKSFLGVWEKKRFFVFSLHASQQVSIYKKYNGVDKLGLENSCGKFTPSTRFFFCKKKLPEEMELETETVSITVLNTRNKTTKIIRFYFFMHLKYCLLLLWTFLKLMNANNTCYAILPIVIHVQYENIYPDVWLPSTSFWETN